MSRHRRTETDLDVKTTPPPALPTTMTDIDPATLVRRALLASAAELATALATVEPADRRRQKALDRWFSGFAAQVRSHHELLDSIVVPALTNRGALDEQALEQLAEDHSWIDELLSRARRRPRRPVVRPRRRSVVARQGRRSRRRPAPRAAGPAATRGGHAHPAGRAASSTPTSATSCTTRPSAPSPPVRSASRWPGSTPTSPSPSARRSTPTPRRPAASSAAPAAAPTSARRSPPSAERPRPPGGIRAPTRTGAGSAAPPSGSRPHPHACRYGGGPMSTRTLSESAVEAAARRLRRPAGRRAPRRRRPTRR